MGAHTHVCRCGECYCCERTRSLSGRGPCEGSMADGDGCCPRCRAEWDAIFRRHAFKEGN